MAAAVADFRPGRVRRTSKIKKARRRDADQHRAGRATPTSWPSCRRSGTRPGQVLVGFAAETGDDGDVANGRAKLARKGADLLVVNEVGDGQGLRRRRQRGDRARRRRLATTEPDGQGRLADAVWDLVASPTVRDAGPRRRSCTAGLHRADGSTRRDVRVHCRKPSHDRRQSSAARSTVARRLFTSESVTEGHPDKIADQISDAHPRRAARARTRAAGSPSRR